MGVILFKNENLVIPPMGAQAALAASCKKDLADAARKSPEILKSFFAQTQKLREKPVNFGRNEKKRARGRKNKNAGFSMKILQNTPAAAALPETEKL